MLQNSIKVNSGAFSLVLSLLAQKISPRSLPDFKNMPGKKFPSLPFINKIGYITLKPTLPPEKSCYLGAFILSFLWGECLFPSLAHLEVWPWCNLTWHGSEGNKKRPMFLLMFVSLKSHYLFLNFDLGECTKLNLIQIQKKTTRLPVNPWDHVFVSLDTSTSLLILWIFQPSQQNDTSNASRVHFADSFV